MSKESKLHLWCFGKDQRVIKDVYREEYDRIFGKRDVLYHTKRSGDMVYKGFDKKGRK